MFWNQRKISNTNPYNHFTSKEKNITEYSKWTELCPSVDRIHTVSSQCYPSLVLLLLIFVAPSAMPDRSNQYLQSMPSMSLLTMDLVLLVFPYFEIIKKYSATFGLWSLMVVVHDFPVDHGEFRRNAALNYGQRHPIRAIAYYRQLLQLNILKLRRTVAGCMCSMNHMLYRLYVAMI
jgi:hypothetical protein